MKTIDRHEEGDLETAYFVPAISSENVYAQSVAIAPLENRETSIIFSKNTGTHSDYKHSINILPVLCLRFLSAGLQIEIAWLFWEVIFDWDDMS